MYWEMFFRRPKKDFGERLTLFRRCFIPDVFGEYQYVENVSFYLNNREICEPIKLPCLREVIVSPSTNYGEIYCATYIEENIANFKNMAYLERLPGANGRRDPLRS